MVCRSVCRLVCLSVGLSVCRFTVSHRDSDPLSLPRPMRIFFQFSVVFEKLFLVLLNYSNNFYLLVYVQIMYFDPYYPKIGFYLSIVTPPLSIFGVGIGFKNYFGVSSYRLMTFVFRVLLYFCSIM